MASSRLLAPERVQFGRRRPHVPQISISDGNHHVTEAIGDMYGDDEGDKRHSRALSIVITPPAYHDGKRQYFDGTDSGSTQDNANLKPRSPERTPSSANGPVMKGGYRRKSSVNSTHSNSPPPLTRTISQEAANQHFPIHDIDYESSPAAVAQELSNLQAIRRMSMNVEASDPDLPSFGPTFSVPTAAPSHGADEDDASRMFWVPARLHPELAPTEFKTFVEDRVERIRRRSNDNELSPDGIDRRGSNSSVNRRRSILSRTVDSGIGYEDGADVLERKRSMGSQHSLDFPDTTLQGLEQALGDPIELVRKMSLDSPRRSLDVGDEGAEDVPILPGAPGGQSLKRSTRTNYRKGSLRRGERVAQSTRRIGQRTSEADPEHPPVETTMITAEPQSLPDEPHFGLTRVQTEPTPPPTAQPDNFSRPSRKTRPTLQPSSSLGEIRRPPPSPEEQAQAEKAPVTGYRNPTSFASRTANNGRSTANMADQADAPANPPVTEPPPPQQDYRHSAPPGPPPIQLPERKSSHDYARQSYAQQMAIERERERPVFSNSRRPNQTLDDMANNPAMIPGGSTRTDTLTFIPSFNEAPAEKKSDKKSKDRKDTGESGSRKPSWGWLGRDPDKKEDKKEKEKEKAREEKEEKELSKKIKVKSRPATAEKPHDDTRLDLLKTATDGPRGRESVVLDRESIKLEEERRKDSTVRKGSGSDAKTTGASGFISSLFGGGKKKNHERDARKTDVNRRLSPSPEPARKLRADIDYNWTRFSILEERAIYRMAHLKLANPRRALYSQVLLSNFMYSYLAKVQQMHPQIQIPAFVQKQQGGQKGGEQDPQPQSDEYSAWQRYQEQNSSPPVSDGSDYVDDFDPSHQEHEDTRRHHEQQQYYGNGNSAYGHQPYPVQDGQWNEKDLYAQQGLFSDSSRPPEGEEDLW